MQGPLADYLNNHLEFQLLQEENISSTRPIDNIDQEEETTDMNIINNRIDLQSDNLQKITLTKNPRSQSVRKEAQIMLLLAK